MLEMLLESRSSWPRSPGGAIVSVTAHTALIAAALYATAQARVPTVRPPTTIRPVYFPPSAPPTVRSGAVARVAAPVTPRRLVFVPAPRVDISRALDLSALVSKAGDFPQESRVGYGARGSELSRTDSSASILTADQVEKQASLAPGSRPPAYPESLRSAGVEGQVTAMFVVDESGRAEDSSVRFARSDNSLFDDAVRTALRRMRFIPAEVGGMKVRQLVQMPFVFTLKK
jgi:protein TonB